MPLLLYVMGPSGAGKDSVLRHARAALAPHERIAFAHRYITRPSDVGGENHVALSDPEFETRRAAGLFAYDWQANGFRYGIGIEITAWRHAGFVVVVNGSREHFRALCPRPPDLRPVLITAPAYVLAERLAGRGREDDMAVARRLDRAGEYRIDDPDVTIIENAARLEEACGRFLALLRDAADGSTRGLAEISTPGE